MTATVPGTTEIRHGYARVNDVLLHYTVAGSGPVVVLLHGWTSTWYQWKARIIPALAPHYTVIAPDMRGVGDSEKPVEEAGYEKKNMAEDIRQLLVHLGHGDESVRVVGHDFGATVAYAYAVAHRELVEQLVILDMPFPGFGYEEGLRFDPPRTDPLGREFWHLAFHDAPSEIFEALVTGRERTYLRYFFQQFSFDPSAVSEADLDEYTRHYASPGGLRSVNYYRTHAADAEYFQESAKNPIAMPVLALGGDHFNAWLVKEAMEQMASDVEGGVIPNCGHWVTDEQPDHVIDALLTFFGTRA